MSREVISFYDYWPEKRAYRSEIEAQPIETVLVRFLDEGARQQAAIWLSEFKSRKFIVGMAIDEMFGVKFRPEVASPNVEAGRHEICPEFNLIVLASLLTGRTNPDEQERLEHLLCGYVVKKEDSFGQFGPLSGRQGENNHVYSQCVKVTRELRDLLVFMKEIEEVPHLETGKKESETLEILRERERIKGKREMQGFVIVTWRDLLKCLSGGVQPKRLMPPQTDSSGLIRLIERYDATLQFDLGGEEYRQLVDWVQTNVFKPLQELVGKNLDWVTQNEDGSVSFRLGHKESAQNCPKSPTPYFSGELSLLSEV